MSCYELQCWYYGKRLNPTGRRSLVRDPRKAYDDKPVWLPCGKCVGCLKGYAAQWRTRLVHESQLYSENVFVTLTYEDKHLPAHASLEKEHVSSFMKRLRNHRPPPIRFFACGEYGEATHRPHYHLLLFNIDFPDKLLYKSARSGEPLYTSRELSEVWTYGHSDIGSVTPRSIGYVASYLTKSVQVPGFYDLRQPEFRLMSRRPGIAREWFNRYGEQCYNYDQCVINGVKVGVPRYYDTLFQDGDRLDVIKALRHAKTLTPEAREDARLIRRLQRERRDLLLIQQLKGDM